MKYLLMTFLTFQDVNGLPGTHGATALPTVEEPVSVTESKISLLTMASNVMEVTLRLRAVMYHPTVITQV